MTLNATAYLSYKVQIHTSHQSTHKSILEVVCDPPPSKTIICLQERVSISRNSLIELSYLFMFVISLPPPTTHLTEIVGSRKYYIVEIMLEGHTHLEIITVTKAWVIRLAFHEEGRKVFGHAKRVCKRSL